MKTNMGSLDRLLRIAIVVPIALGLAFWLGIGKALGIVLVAVAAVMALTSAMGFCPLYAPFGINTCGRRDKPTSST